jgi:apolipoprotein N-acyltransferase
VIDAYGRTIHSLGLNATGVIDSRLPAAIPGTTLFARSGEFGIFFLLFGVLYVAFIVRKT